jgi:hypothetical protein
VSYTVLPNGRNYFATSTGVPAVGYKVYAFVAGTSTPKDTYTDYTGGTPNAHPIVLDARGEAAIYWNGTYDVVLKDAAGSVIWGPERVRSIDEDLRTDLALSSGSSLVGFLQTGTGAVARTAQAKMRDEVSVKDFGATGDGSTDDTAAIQATFNAAIASQFKRIVFPDGVYKVSSAITVAPYYDAGLPTELIAANGADYEVDFGRAHIKCTGAAASSVFIFTSAAYPSTRYGLEIHGGSFSFTNAVADVFKFTGSGMWMCQMWGMSFINGSPTCIVKMPSDSGTMDPGTFVFRDIVARADKFFHLTSSGGLLLADNFTFDNIYFFGLSASGAVVYLDTSCGLQNSTLSKIVQVGVGYIVNSPAGGGYLSYSRMTGMYSETTTNNAVLVNCLLSNCSMVDCRSSVNNSTTQTVQWFNGFASNSTFHNCHVTDVNLSGAKPYDSEAYAYYPVIAFGGASINNTVSGYSRGEYKNAVEARSGAIISAVGVSEPKVLTVNDYTATGLVAVAFTQVGNTIPNVAYLGTNFILDVEMSGVAYTAGAKTIAVKVKIGGTSITIGAAMAAAVDVWSAKGRLYFRKVTGTTWNVVMGYSQSWVGATPTAGTRIGTTDVGVTTVNDTDAISFGLDITAIAAGTVLITDATIKVIDRFGIYDTLV